jgi:beta-phosphoglucomutase-like phosphatase (HAD superfamily)
MLTTLLWDHDGILVETEGLYFQATREILARVGVELSEALYRQLFLVEARGAWHLAEQRGVDAVTLEGLKQARNERYTELLVSQDVLVPGVLDLLDRLKGRFRMAIVTSSRRAHFDAIHGARARPGERFGRTSGIPERFELILAREDYENSKPDPEPYLTAMARLGVQPRECLVIEDSERGVIAGHAAGVRCWALPSALTRDSSFALAERTFESLPELASALALEGR